tara:strand:- start:97 stop:426 length:330 start_codon:yes stop_codon:yes gene_type:complete
MKITKTTNIKVLYKYSLLNGIIFIQENKNENNIINGNELPKFSKTILKVRTISSEKAKGFLKSSFDLIMVLKKIYKLLNNFKINKKLTKKIQAYNQPITKCISNIINKA